MKMQPDACAKPCANLSPPCTPQGFEARHLNILNNNYNRFTEPKHRYARFSTMSCTTRKNEYRQVITRGLLTQSYRAPTRAAAGCAKPLGCII